MRLLRRLESLPVRSADLIVGHPLFVLGILLSLTAVAGYSARNLRFDFNPEAVFSSKNPEIEDAEQFSRDFGDNENVIILGFEATGKVHVLTPAALTWQAETVHAFEHLPHVVRVESLISMETPHVTLSLPPKMTYEPIISETPVRVKRRIRSRERLGQTEMPFGSLVSKDEKMSAEMVVFDASRARVRRDGGDGQERRRHAGQVPASPRVIARSVSGLPVLRVGIVRDLGKDQARLMPLAGILYLITLALAFRSFGEPVAAVSPSGRG